jgi:hypothetical protein
VSRAVRTVGRLVVVPPSALSAPVRAALRCAAEACGTKVTDAPNLDGRPGNGALVICADASGADLARLSLSLVVLGDPDHATAAVRDWPSVPTNDAIVFASRCYAHATALSRGGVGTVIGEAAFRSDAEGALDEMLATLNLIPPPDKAEILRSEFRSALEQSIAAAEASPNSLARDALALYRDREGPARAWWPRELFKWGDDPVSAPPPSMDITGVPRSLVIGPYLSVSPGTWRVTATFEVDDDAALRFYLVSLGSGDDFSHERTFRLKPGRNELSVTHRFRAVGPAEFALGVPFGGFHGTLRFLGAAIEAVEEPSVAQAASAYAPPVQSVD